MTKSRLCKTNFKDRLTISLCLYFLLFFICQGLIFTSISLTFSLLSCRLSLLKKIITKTSSIRPFLNDHVSPHYLLTVV